MTRRDFLYDISKYTISYTNFKCEIILLKWIDCSTEFKTSRYVRVCARARAHVCVHVCVKAFSWSRKLIPGEEGVPEAFGKGFPASIFHSQEAPCGSQVPCPKCQVYIWFYFCQIREEKISDMTIGYPFE